MVLATSTVVGLGVGDRKREREKLHLLAKLSEQNAVGFVCSGNWRFVVGLVVYSVLKDCTAFVFKGRGLLDT